MSTFLARTALLAQAKVARKEGIYLVRKVMALPESENGFTTAEIFQRLQKETVPDHFPSFQVEHATTVSYGKGSTLRKPPPPPPHPDHPIRSVSFLKRDVLQYLSQSKELRICSVKRIPATMEVPKTHSKVTGPWMKSSRAAEKAAAEAALALSHPVTVWVWKKVDQRTVHAPQVRQRVPGLGAALGIDDDLTHLSRRRRRTRVQKIHADIRRLKAEEQSSTS